MARSKLDNKYSERETRRRVEAALEAAFSRALYVVGVSPYQRAIESWGRGAGRPAVAHLPPSMCLPCATPSNGTFSLVIG